MENIIKKKKEMYLNIVDIVVQLWERSPPGAIFRQVYGSTKISVID